LIHVIEELKAASGQPNVRSHAMQQELASFRTNVDSDELC